MLCIILYCVFTEHASTECYVKCALSSTMFLEFLKQGKMLIGNALNLTKYTGVVVCILEDLLEYSLCNRETGLTSLESW